MNDKQTIEKLKDWCSNKDPGIFSRYYYFEETRLIEECNIQIIQQLPERLCFPEESENTYFTAKGIKAFEKEFVWSEILATAVRRERKKFSLLHNYKTFIILGLKKGQIFEFEIWGNSKYLNQIGHLIELYKIKFKKELKPNL